MNPADLTQRPPRSPRVRLGGYVILARMLDKGRATVAGSPGEYHYACPLDQRFLDFAGVEAEALQEQLAAGKGDGQIVAWIAENSSRKPEAAAIEAWSELQERRVPGDVESRGFFNEIHTAAAKDRKDVYTWFELLDLDDYVTFGGKA